MPWSRDADMMSLEEKRAMAEEVLKRVFPQWELDEFSETFENGTDRIRIGLKWFQIDPSEGNE